MSAKVVFIMMSLVQAVVKTINNHLSNVTVKMLLEIYKTVSDISSCHYENNRLPVERNLNKVCQYN